MKMNNYKYEQIRIPESLSERVEKGIAAGEAIYRKNKRRKRIIKAGASAATVILGICIFASSPALASRVPVIRDIFKLFQDDYSYPGDFDSVAEKLEEPETKETEANEQAEENSVTEDMKYTKTNNGVTVSVSEAYCSTEAIYMSLIITSEEKFPETGAAWDKPIICIETAERYPFTDAEDPGYGFGYLEGSFLDDYTYAGIYRIDIKDITQGDHKKKEELLMSDRLSMDFTIIRIIGDKANPDKPDYQGKTKEELEAMTDEEWNAFMKEVYDEEWSRFPNAHEHWWYEGPFTFEPDIAVDKENARIVMVNERNETGAGIYSVSKTLFEITVETDCSEERLKQGIYVVALDADGKLLSRGSSAWTTTFVVGDREVSKIYVYLCDAQEYLDELIEYRESENFRQILEEKALYGKEIEFH